jgi:hypothetical protein
MAVRTRWMAGAVACVMVFGGCDQAREFLAGTPAPLPTPEELAPYYAAYENVVGIELSGNVVELEVTQPYDQLQRGGSLWARVGPYVYLFTPATRQVFYDYPSVAAVRVVTVVPHGEEVARAMLRRDTMGDIQWRRSLNVLGWALQEGTKSPRRLEQLTDWGEAHSEFRYNPDYVR